MEDKVKKDVKQAQFTLLIIKENRLVSVAQLDRALAS